MEKLIDEVDTFISTALGEKRYKHSLRVAKTAVRLCKKYGEDVELGKLAGLAHDMCKEMSDDELISVATHDGAGINEFEIKKPGLLHGRAAAIKLKEDFDVTNSAVLEAVREHTIGKVGMCNLAKILYVADKIEPKRPQVTGEYLKKLEVLDLDTLLVVVMKENIAYLDFKGKTVSPASRDLLSLLERQRAEGING
jgi:nicotinate-nucleotide adenylyltransferase